MSYPDLPNKPTDVVFDLDDFQFTLRNGTVGDVSLGYLFYLKYLFPKFKVTLFAIPALCSSSVLRRVGSLGWVELAVHGWKHETNYECNEMTKEQCLELLNKVEEQYGDIFVKGFKAPGWQISDGCYDALLEKGYWVADHTYNEDRRPKELPAYTLAHPWCIHGHTWDIQTPQVDQRNGIRQLIEERGLGEKLTQETNFHFISEVILAQQEGISGFNPHTDEPLGEYAEPDDGKGPSTYRDLYADVDCDRKEVKQNGEGRAGQQSEQSDSEHIHNPASADGLYREVLIDTTPVQPAGDIPNDSDRPEQEWVL